jgi:hypothetical protein
MASTVDIAHQHLARTQDDCQGLIDLMADTPPTSPLVAHQSLLAEQAIESIIEVKPNISIEVHSSGDESDNLEEEILPAWLPVDEDVILEHVSPPAQRFPSRDAIIKYLNDFAASLGFALVILNSSTASRKAYLGCICHAQKVRSSEAEDPLLSIPGTELYDRPAKKRKGRRTIKTGCTFKIYIKDRSLKDNNAARGRGHLAGDLESWSFDICAGFDKHNHSPLPAVAVAFIRRFGPEEKAFVIREIKKGTAAMSIVRGFLDQWPSRPVQARDIWNLAYAVRKDERAGFSAAEATLAKMCYRRPRKSSKGLLPRVYFRRHNVACDRFLDASEVGSRDYDVSRSFSSSG